MTPKPASVRYNDWRSVAVEPLDTFTPTMPVSVIIPYYQTPADILARTLAGLERQTYPRDLFEVIIADDGSEPPLSTLPATSLDVKVVRQERRGFGLARARNTGARAAAHDILLFLDSDIITDADWVASHARWHHAVSDALTFGPPLYVSVNDIDAETIRRCSGNLKELFSDRPADTSWTVPYLTRTEHLTSKPDGLFSTFDDIFKVVIGNNIGVSRDFYWSVGGFDESFTRWGWEDIEFGYRAYTRGGLLIPLRDTIKWHQGRWEEHRDAKAAERRLQSGKASNLIAHPRFRAKHLGRAFKVPQHVVTIDAGRAAVDQTIATVVNILSDPVYDLVVRIELPPNDDAERLALLEDDFGADSRVRIAPTRSALDEFPASPFHITLPAGSVFSKGLVRRLRARLGDAAIAYATFSDMGTVSITRAWALHRARRVGGSAADFGAVRKIPARALKHKRVKPVEYSSRSTRVDTLRYWIANIHSLKDAWALLKSLVVVARGVRTW